MRMSRDTTAAISKFLLGALALGILYFSVDISEVLLTLIKSNKLLLLASVPFYLLTRGLKVYIWRFALATQEVKISNWVSLKSIFATGIPAFIAPGVVGTFARPLYLKDRYGVPLKKGVAAFVLEQFISISSYTIVLSLLLFAASGLHQVVIALSFLITFFIAAQVIFLYALFREHDFLMDELPWGEKILEQKKSVRRSFKDWENIAKALIVQVAIYIGTVGMTSYILLQALSYTPRLIIPALIPSAAQSLSVVPVTPAGLGTIELSGVFLMSRFAVPTDVATSFFVLHRIIPTSINLIGGYLIGADWIEGKMSKK